MVEYRALGGLTLSDNGDEVSVGGPRQRRLVAMLLIHRNTVVSADQLSEAVFAGDPTPSARTTLRSYVARLRRVIDGDGAGSGVVFRAPGYMLEVPDDAFDVPCFERLVAEARSRLARDDAVAAASALRAALALWGGDAYPEFAAEDWARPEAQRLGELRLVAYENLVDAELACGRAAELIPQLENLVAEHPLREAFQAQLMLALYRGGRQVDALRAFQHYRQELAEEVGLEPSPELTDLERGILAHDPGLRLVEPAGMPLRGYRLGERLGTGRLGTVFAARLPGVERELVIRVFRPEIADDPDVVRSFEADAQRIAALRHEAVVPIHDYWREPGAAYLVMRRMSGGSLSDRLERGRLANGEVAQLAARVGAALTAAADRGIVHGRVTAENVLFDDAGAAYLSDFAVGTAGACRPANDLRDFAALIGECLTRHCAARPGAGATENGGLPASLAEVLSRAAAPSGRPTISELVGALVAALDGEAEPSAAAPPNPYKGLRAFDEADAADFFGREDLVDEVLARLDRDDRRGRLVLVVGGSGSGKSSLVRAGLLPRVRQGAVPGSDRWFVTTMLPGASPFKELAEGLRRVAVVDTDRLDDELASETAGIDDVLRRLVPDGGQLLLVVDQLEELFTLATEAEQRGFLDGLLHAVTAPDSRLRVVMTLRADFYDRPLRFHRFGPVVRDATVTVPAMSAAELEAAVARPGDRVGVRVEQALVAELVTAVIDEPAALPSLQYTLYELTARSPDRSLSLAAYRDLGGVDAAIAARAEQLYRSLDDADRDAVRRAFERLVVVSADGEPTRRRAPRSELVALVPGRTIDDAVEAWVHARLLTSDHDPATREPTIEVAHEALLREWPRLRAWIDEDRDAIVAAGQLRDAATTWDHLDRDPGALYRGTRLEVALERTGSRTDTLPTREREFLDASRDERDRERRREAERIARQARANRRLRIQLGALAVALVLALTGGFVAVDQRDRADARGRLATARELAAAATANLDVDPERSILLALEAVELTRDGGSALPEAVEALHRAMTASRIVMRVPGLGGALDWSPDGTVFVTEGPEDSGVVDLRDARTGESVRSWVGHDVDINFVAFSPDGTMLATTGDDGAARVWDPRTGDELWSIESPEQSNVAGVTFSPDGTRLAAAFVSEQVVRLIDLRTGLTVREIPSGAHRAAFSPDGERLALVGPDQPEAVVVDARSGREVLRLVGHLWGLQDAAWSPDGRWIATAGDDTDVRIWDARTGKGRSTLFGHSANVVSLEWSPDSRNLASGALDGTARVWRAFGQGGRQMLALAGHGTGSGVAGVAFSPNGDRLLTGSMDISAVSVWDVSIGGDAEWAHLPAAPAFLGGAAFTPDGDRLVASSVDGSATVWDAETGARALTFGPPGAAAPPSGRDVLGIDTLLDPPGEADVVAVAVSPDGELIATAREGGVTTISDAGTGDEVASFGPRDVAGIEQATATEVFDLAWSSDGEVLATAGLEDGRGMVSIVDRAGRRVSVLRDDPRVAVGSVAFSPDGRSVATARARLDRFDPDLPGVQIWDWEGGAVTASIETIAATVAYDPGGMRLVTTSDVSDVAEIWDVESRERVGTLEGHEGAVTDAAFGPDGSSIATAGLDGTVRLWDAGSGTQALVLRGHRTAVGQVAFSPDGSKVASVSGDGTARIWALDLDDLVAMAERELTRDLTDAECRQYLHQDRCPRA
jgi:WD40 repeat protein/DNA-binding SARP family transcriptional activator/energy-coupling factor transporter ATP-binding protein EcfA2